MFFDLVTPLDLTSVRTSIGGSLSFGAGPTTQQLLTGGTPVQNITVLIGYNTSATSSATAFNTATWAADGNGVNGSTAGWGYSNNNFNSYPDDTGEIIITDFHDADAFGTAVPPGGNPFGQLVTFATYKFPNFDSGDIVYYQATYENADSSPAGASAITQITGAQLTSATGMQIDAPSGKFLDYVTFYVQDGNGKFQIIDAGVTTANIDVTIPFTLNLTDGDGDRTATDNFTVRVANGLVPFTPAAPIVIDLKANGFNFLSQAAGVMFDYIGNGSLAKTAWAGNDDGILGIDLDGDGRIDSAKEFVFGGNGQTDLEGLAAKYDSNHDGLLDANDAEFAKFGVWQDADSDGVNDSGEFHTLAELGIKSIDLTSDGKSYFAADGDVTVHGQTSFTWSDGTIGLAADASFAVSGGGTTMDALLSLGTLAANDAGPEQQAAHLPAVLEALNEADASGFIDNLVNSLGSSGGSEEGGAHGAASDGALLGMLENEVGSDHGYGGMPLDLGQIMDEANAMAAA